jgi:hypothetical protein
MKIIFLSDNSCNIIIKNYLLEKNNMFDQKIMTEWFRNYLSSNFNKHKYRWEFDNDTYMYDQTLYTFDLFLTLHAENIKEKITDFSLRFN